MEPLAVQPPAVRASDEDRERTVAILREHWGAGRLTLAELEARCEEAWGARMVSGLWHAVRELPVPAPARPPAETAPASPGGGKAVAGFVLGVVAACILLLSFSLLSFVSLPASGAAWVLGRRARRSGATGSHHGLAVAGEVLGALGTTLGGLAVAWWTAVVLGLYPL